MTGREHLDALAALYAPAPSELREAINAALSRAVDMGRALHDQHATAILTMQLTGIIRTLQRLAPMLEAEAVPHDPT